MFKTETIHQDGFEIIVLRDLKSSTSAAIIPACGGILHGFSVQHKGSALNLIDHYESKKDFTDNVTAKGFKSCKLSPFACRINQAIYQFEEKKYQVRKFILNGSALHGLIYDADFKVIKQEATEEGASLILQYQYRGEDPGYPFHFDCLLTYELRKNNELKILTEITNQHDTSIPIQDGWHPYFSFNKPIDELELEFQSLEQVVFNDQLIPTGRLTPYVNFLKAKKIGDSFFDNCFTLNFNHKKPHCILRDPANNIQIEILPEKSYPYLQIYTPPHRQSIAIENLSAPPDTFNNGIDLIILQPMDIANFATTYKIKILG